MLLNQDVDHVSILVYRTSEIVPLSLDVHEELVQVTDVSEPTLSILELPSVLRSRRDRPLLRLSQLCRLYYMSRYRALILTDPFVVTTRIG